MVIRSEKAQDHEQIGNIHSISFKHDLEKVLIENIRNEACFDPELSLVAEEDNQVIGHILFSKVTIEDSFRSTPALVLGPLSVLPEYRSQGAGTLLIENGLRIAKLKGFDIILVLGHGYYERFGFKPAGDHGIFRPNPLKGEHFMVLSMKASGLEGVRGVVKYPRAFHPLVYKWE